MNYITDEWIVHNHTTYNVVVTSESGYFCLVRRFEYGCYWQPIFFQLNRCNIYFCELEAYPTLFELKTWKFRIYPNRCMRSGDLCYFDGAMVIKNIYLTCLIRLQPWLVNACKNDNVIIHWQASYNSSRMLNMCTIFSPRCYLWLAPNHVQDITGLISRD